MAVVLDPRELSNLGTFLRDGRQRRGLSLDEIASVTRIPRRHLDALEHGDLGALPKGMYRRAEVRAFADAVGLDRDVALAHLDQALDQHVTAEPPAFRPPLEAPRRHWGAYAALALLAAATLVLATRWQWLPSPSSNALADVPPATLEAAVEVPAEPPSAPSLPTATAPPPATTAKPTPVATAVATDASAAAAAAAPPAEISLVVTSSPEGARVLVDGIGWGRSPVTVRNVTPGNRRLRVVLDGFVSGERLVRVGQGETKVHIDLVPAN
jgi:cytoskeletal protein RodZ